MGGKMLAWTEGGARQGAGQGTGPGQRQQGQNAHVLLVPAWHDRVSTRPHSSMAGAQGYWRFGAVPRAVPVVWNQYTFYSIGYTTTLVVASIFYSR